MLLADIEGRIAHIQETIKQAEEKAQGYALSLQQSTQQLSVLTGHLTECFHWKNQIETPNLENPVLQDAHNTQPMTEETA